MKQAADNSGFPLLNEMELSLLNHGGKQSDIIRLHNIINNFIEDGKSVCPIIYIPFAEDNNLQYMPPTVSKKETNTQENDLRGWQLNSSNGFDEVNIDEMKAKTTAVWMITRIVCNDETGPIALPWHRCYCIKEASGGGANPILTGGGTCSASKGADGACTTKCGRATFGGDCPGSFCPPCH